MEETMARDDTTDKKPRAAERGRSGPPSVPVMSYSVELFCQAHSISQAWYYAMRKRGLGPDETRIGTRRLITAEAAARWRKRMEEKSADGTTIPVCAEHEADTAATSA
jgi:hypothetical protein